MRRKLIILSVTLLLTLAIGAILNIKVTTSQGINFRVSKIELPLYLKVLNFFDRHFNYMWLAKRITQNLDTKEEKVFKLFKWTHETIQPQPAKLPIMDDHVWNVYVRGYGVSDHYHDLFSTLCNYIGIPGIFLKIKAKDSGNLLDLSFVKIGNDWIVFDPYRGVYFLNKLGEWATLEEINEQNWKLAKLGSIEISDSFYTHVTGEISDSFYRPYFEAMPDIEAVSLTRTNIQSPINRLQFQLKQWISGRETFVGRAGIVTN